MTVRIDVQGALPTDTLIEMLPCAGDGQNVVLSQIAVTGGIEVRGVSPGCYRVSLMAFREGRRIYEGIHNVRGAGEPLQIRLPDAKRAEGPASSTVSFGALRPKPPKRVMRLFNHASDLSARGRYAEAADELREVVRRHPAFAEAYVNLGAQLVRLGKNEEATVHFRQARTLGIADATLEANEAAAYLALGRMDEAELAIKRALSQNPNLPAAHFLMGQLILRTGGPAQAAENHLLKARELPAGRVLLAQLLARTGRASEAAGELRAYLDTGHQSYRALASYLLAQLRRGSN